MPILQGDIKFRASQVMDDVPEGGGAPSATVIPDGASNGVFKDVSETDRAGGRVSARKVFLHVQTNNVDGYLGANAIVAKNYADPRVSVALFKTDDPFDRRAAAMSRVEAYLARGASYPGYLFGDHLAGQGVLLVLQRPELPLPGVGDTLVLSKNIGLPTQVDEYVRLRSVGATARTFTDGQGDFTRTLLALELTGSLSVDFPGFDAMRIDATVNFANKTKISETVVADSGRYFGSSALVDDGSIGDTVVKVDSIFTQLVPSTRQEVPIADSRVNQQSTANLAAGASGAVAFASVWTSAQPLFLGCAVTPGSFSIVRDGTTLTDKGGLLMSSGTAVGTIDYGNGIARLGSNVFGTGSGTQTATFTPAASATIVTDSLGIVVTQAGQRLNWVYTLDPVPARGTLSVAYRALGKWYVLADDGSGSLRGSDSSYGAGTINFTTGTVALTLGVLPDVDSRIISLWATQASTRTLADVPAYSPSFSRKLRKTVTITQTIKPGTVALAWNDGVARTATDVNGELTGDATGTVNYGAGEIQFSPNVLPAKGTAVALTITRTTELKSAVNTFTDGGATWTFSLGGVVKPNSVQLGVVAQWPERQFPGTDSTLKRSMLVLDDGAGNLVVGNMTSLLTVGTINYANGDCTITKSVGGLQTEQPTFEIRTPVSGGADPSSYVKQTGYETRTVAITFLNGPGGAALSTPAWVWWAGAQTTAAEYRASGADGATGQSWPFTLDELAFPAFDNRTTSLADYIASVVTFKVGASRYVVNQAGVVRDPSPVTGLGDAAGSVDGSWVRVSSWPVGASPTPSALAGARVPGVSGSGSRQLVDTVTARTAVSPLVPSSFTIAGNWADGTTFTATADANGRVSSGSANVGATPGSLGVFGIVDYETGVVDLRFGRRVSSGFVGSLDISSLGVPGVTNILSAGTMADTLRYNAVGYTYLPLDPDILGLDTGRLPADGRVPIFREGMFVVVGHSAETPPAAVSNGQTINCARVRLSGVRVIGNDDNTISAGFTADLDAGTVTFTNVTGYSQPVRVEHRVEDMAVVNDVQISGHLTLGRPLTHDFPAAGSYVSSCVMFGDVSARVSTVFDLQSWNGNTWLDNANGATPATATFNNIQHPITVTNAGAFTERWAVVIQSNNTSFNVIGENLGVVATGTINDTCAPTNPWTGTPFFTIPSDGWGSAWAAGNVLRFNTVGAIPPLWVLRTVLQGPETVTNDKFLLLGRGGVDRP